MSWKQNLRTPSFRGVRFNLWNVEREGGRAGVTHSFVGRDVPYTEDVARVPRTYSFDAFISGFDFFRQRDRLIEALEKPGPGELVHPYYGSLQVNVTRYRIRDSGSEGNIVRFELQFVEAGSLSFPTVVVKKGGIFSKIADAISDTAGAKFLKDFDIVGKVQFVVDAAQSKITELSEDLNAATSIITTTSDKISDLATSITDLRIDANTLINTPAVLVQRMSHALSLVQESVTEPRESFKAYKNIFDYGSSDPILTRISESRIQQDTNNKAFTNYIRTMAASNAVSAAVQISYKSEEDAKKVRTALYDHLDVLMEDVQDDSVFAELNNLRTFISLNIPPSDENLPHVFDYENLDTRPSVVVAYEIFGDVISELDIVDRNDIKNPNYVPGSKVLRVLSRV